MFERFSDDARQVFVLAQEEARNLSHNYLGTEHMLLGLLRIDGPAGRVLESLGLSLEAARQQVGEIGRGDESSLGYLAFTPRAKTVVELSAIEAEQLGQGDDVNAAHILLGLIHEGHGVAVQVLYGLGADLGLARQRVIDDIGDARSKGEA